jgi:hypothetical protein
LSASHYFKIPMAETSDAASRRAGTGARPYGIVVFPDKCVR